MTLEVYRLPAVTGVYCYGLDSSKGSGGDASVLCILDASRNPVEEVACFRSRTANGQDLAWCASALHRVYPVFKGSKWGMKSGGLVPETNYGELRAELENCFPAEYWYVQEAPPTPHRPTARPAQYGFYTTRPSKTRLIARLHTAIQNRAILWHNSWILDEARYWTRREGHWEFTLASGTALGHGDVTMALALALAGVDAIGAQLEQRHALPRGPVAPARYTNLSSLTLPTSPGPRGQARWNAMRADGQLVEAP